MTCRFGEGQAYMEPLYSIIWPWEDIPTQGVPRGQKRVAKLDNLGEGNLILSYSVFCLQFFVCNTFLSSWCNLFLFTLLSINSPNLFSLFSRDWEEERRSAHGHCTHVTDWLTDWAWYRSALGATMRKIDGAPDNQTFSLWGHVGWHCKIILDIHGCTFITLLKVVS